MYLSLKTELMIQNIKGDILIKLDLNQNITANWKSKSCAILHLRAYNQGLPFPKDYEYALLSNLFQLIKMKIEIVTLWSFSYFIKSFFHLCFQNRQVNFFYERITNTCTFDLIQKKKTDIKIRILRIYASSREVHCYIHFWNRVI